MDSDNKYSFFDSFPEGVQVISKEYRYLYVNEVVAKQGKKAVKDLLGNIMSDVYPGIDKTEVFEEIVNCMKSGKSSNMLNPFNYPDGTTEVFELRLRPVPDGVLIMSEEVTERERKMAESKTLFDNLISRESKMVELKEKIAELESKLKDQV